MYNVRENFNKALHCNGSFRFVSSAQSSRNGMYLLLLKVGLDLDTFC